MNATDPRRWLRDARRAIARLPSLRMRRVPDAPALPVRDPWPGNSAAAQGCCGANWSLAAACAHCGRAPGVKRPASAPLDASAHSFTWLRDLRALGTDAARLRARALVAEWIASPPGEALAHRPDVVGARIDRLARPLRFLCGHRG